ncbi:hypothetical protein [Streptomyces sp. NBC_00347]|uniref:hypothetical protein n=1 Tax=Streptomyces sp. NBC_00347 TaxID=2975721 RepID=UPI00225AA21E|nr:hypothetical protein [Streptomyces sp. NBC_00347]MCX5129940.1 hypothetical protein [Streptomyces sp. NBC_00347]
MHAEFAFPDVDHLVREVVAVPGDVTDQGDFQQGQSAFGVLSTGLDLEGRGQGNASGPALAGQQLDESLA